MKLLEVTKIQRDAAVERAKLLEDRLAAKDEIIRAKDGTIGVKDEQIALLKAANADRAQVNTGDARVNLMLEQQLAKADAEIHRLRNPGFFARMFKPDTLAASAFGYGICRATAPR